MYTSTLLSSASDSLPHTLAMMSSLGMTDLGVDMRRRSTSNSLKPSRTDLPAQLRQRVDRLRDRSDTVRHWDRASPYRRVRARTRASSSPESKGLVI